MTREELIEVMARAMRTLDYATSLYDEKSAFILAALEAAGVVFLPGNGTGPGVALR